LTSETQSTGFLQRADQFGRWVENACLASLLIGMIFLASSQIFLRNFAGSGFPWADEALRLMVLWVAMLGAVAAARDDRQIAIDVLSRFMPVKPQLFTLAAMNLLTSIVSFTLAWYCFDFVSQSYAYEDLVLNDMPAWVFQSILPVAFFLLGYRYLIWTLRRLAAFFSKEDVAT
jgi:TRAP-type C4-dicarboxylate transport system permease small subunit